jgi:hypothetical protein
VSGEKSGDAIAIKQSRHGDCCFSTRSTPGSLVGRSDRKAAPSRSPPLLRAVVDNRDQHGAELLLAALSMAWFTGL